MCVYTRETKKEKVHRTLVTTQKKMYLGNRSGSVVHVVHRSTGKQTKWSIILFFSCTSPDSSRVLKGNLVT